MSERTVSVELTHDEVVYLQASNDACSMLPGGLLHKLYVARSQFGVDRDREANVEFIRLYHHPLRMPMPERTVSVELTEDQIRILHGMVIHSQGTLTHREEAYSQLMQILTSALTDRDREAKVQALYDWDEDSNTDDMENARSMLSRLNNAGWDLVRMEDKKPYSEWEVRDMMNAAYRSEEK
jgi:hypothetical protein